MNFLIKRKTIFSDINDGLRSGTLIYLFFSLSHQLQGAQPKVFILTFAIITMASMLSIYNFIYRMKVVKYIPLLVAILSGLVSDSTLFCLLMFVAFCVYPSLPNTKLQAVITCVFLYLCSLYLDLFFGFTYYLLILLIFLLM